MALNGERKHCIANFDFKKRKYKSNRTMIARTSIKYSEPERCFLAELPFLGTRHFSSKYCNKKIFFSSKYCSHISKSFQKNRNKYFQFTQLKKFWLKNILFSQYLFIEILCVITFFTFIQQFFKPLREKLKFQSE